MLAAVVAPRSNGSSASRAAASTWASLTWPAEFSCAYFAAYSPARLPKTIRSESELPPIRFDRLARGSFDLGVVDLAGGIFLRVFRGVFTRAFAEDDQVGK